MAPASNEEQFKFLISCIRYSNNGKVDFGQVAKECKIVTKGAAAKRYERMMRSHGIAPNAASIKPAPSSSTNSASSSTPTTARSKASSAKKRKFSGEEENMDDEEESSTSNQGQGASKNRVKKEIKSESERVIKEEMYREDSPSAQLQEGLQMGLGAGLCDINRELVGYYSGGSSVGGGSVDGDNLEGYEGGMNAGSMNSGGMNAGRINCYSGPQTDYSYGAGAYGGMMGGRGMMGSGNGMGENGIGGTGMSSHSGQKMMTPRSYASSSGGLNMGAQQYQSMGQGYERSGRSESPLLVE